MRYLVGVQPTGKLHIGNYLGCIKKGLDKQKEGHDVTFLLANYHSLTTNSYKNTTKLELERIGCKKIVEQSPAYTELFFKICCKMNLGSLTKMPQYKDKKDSVQYDLGLLLYPALMIADIIINDPDVVIVGSDQIAHLDLCNDVAKRVGGRKRYEYDFGHIDKVRSLKDPTKKMSKSLGANHVLYLFDDYEKKIKKANTNDEGLANLLKISKELGIDANYDSNLELKMSIANKMEEIFGVIA